MGRKAAEIIEMLTEDHDRLLVLFAAFERLRQSASDDAKQSLVEIACTEVVIHAQVEEGHLYPALAEVMDDLFPLEQAAVQHLVVRRLVEELETMQAGDHLYDAKFAVLATCLSTHIEHEQTRLFPLMEGMDPPFDSLAQDIRACRHELVWMRRMPAIATMWHGGRITGITDNNALFLMKLNLPSAFG
jgi:hypothetical protein